MAVEPKAEPELKEQKAEFSTMSGHPIESLYGPDGAAADPEK
jgi:hypothetical protein